jgi:hypothetical protein
MSQSQSHAPALRMLRDTLDASRENRLPTEELCRAWRAQSTLLAALPPRYGAVMEDLLARMEAGSLFGEESCSFSPEDLRASLSSWLDKAEQLLGA